MADDVFAGLAAVLAVAPVQVDPHRQARKGIPEIVYAAGKPTALSVAAVRELLARQPTGRVLVSRATSDLASALEADHGQGDATVTRAPNGATLLVSRADATEPRLTGGVVGLLTAGASDAPAADEAAWVAHEMGCRVVRFDDVGVAGLHRLEAPLRALRAADTDVIVVVAGMDGALPSVVAGLVDTPVIGLPTSVGYGLGGGGLAALLSMLQTCAPGLVVVNIDNGVGAGATAALIANRAAAARRGATAAGADA
ncbi:MAG: nickel pincer cofactor biosynthesis protein LarB [Chloroflexota bacterium]